jgi:hypothetical protein
MKKMTMTGKIQSINGFLVANKTINCRETHLVQISQIDGLTSHQDPHDVKGGSYIQFNKRIKWYYNSREAMLKDYNHIVDIILGKANKVTI